MTTTAPDVDLDVLQALDWQHETPCQTVNCAGHRGPARWRFVMRCGCVVLSCQPCKDKHDQDAALDLPGRFECLLCGAPLGRRYAAVFLSIEPLQ